jgi:hypothetical protein
MPCGRSASGHQIISVNPLGRAMGDGKSLAIVRFLGASGLPSLRLAFA